MMQIESTCRISDEKKNSTTNEMFDKIECMCYKFSGIKWFYSIKIVRAVAAASINEIYTIYFISFLLFRTPLRVGEVLPSGQKVQLSLYMVLRVFRPSKLIIGVFGPCCYVVTVSAPRISKILLIVSILSSIGQAASAGQTEK